MDFSHIVALMWISCGHGRGMSLVIWPVALKSTFVFALWIVEYGIITIDWTSRSDSTPSLLLKTA